MKEIPRSLSSVGRVRLRKSDLRALANLLTSDGGVLEISTDKYKFVSLDEFLSFEEPVATLRLVRQTTPHVDVNVSLHSSSAGVISAGVFASSADNATIGVFSQVEAFLQSRREKVHPAILVAVGTGVLAIGVGILGTLLKQVFLAYGAASGIILAGLGLGHHLLFADDPPSLKFRRESGSPVNWRGVGWDLTKMVLAGILGALLTLFVQWCRAPSPQTPHTSVVLPSAEHAGSEAPQP